MKLLAALICGLLVLGFSAASKPVGKLMHVVSFKFKSTASTEDIKNIEAAFEQLKHNIPQVVTLEWGTNVSPEQRNKGFTHCFVLTFNSNQDRDAYLEHPAHKAFGKMVGPVLEDVFVIDFWTKG